VVRGAEYALRDGGAVRGAAERPPDGAGADRTCGVAERLVGGALR